jgi:predicted dehydrogenase/nucleoside-diphosphate-sugar epimerase
VIRIALVGCGAIAEHHARALEHVPGAELAALVDVDRTRAAELRDRLRLRAPIVASDADLGGIADAAIVAVPNSFHADLTAGLLSCGLHVLCEKPLATRVADAERMVALAAERERVLSCGLIRRFYGSTRLCERALRMEVVGRPVRCEAREAVWNWPLARSVFDRAVAGGGVAMDMGPHLIDLIGLLLGPVELFRYSDDAAGGVEANAWFDLRASGEWGPIPATVHLSRTGRMRNYLRIECTGGAIEVDPHERDSIRLRFKNEQGEPLESVARARAVDPFVAQLLDFVAAIAGAPPSAPAAAAVPSLRVIESAYAQAQAPRIEVGASFAGRVLVTGAAGMVGSRLIEMWAERGELGRLRCALRGYRSAARIMRYPVEVVEADLLDRVALRRACEGVSAIVHLGVGEKAAAETRPLVEVALARGVRRFVHMSSAAVYGAALPESIDAQQEDTPTRETGEPYADQKAAAERIVLRAARRGLDAILLRPSIVYGPGMRWSAELMELLAEGRVPIVEGEGVCNLIYVDDLVRAVDRALATSRGFGETYFVTDGAPILWSEYIARHAALLGCAPKRVPGRAPAARSLPDLLKESVRPLPPLLRSAEFRALVLESPLMRSTALRAYLMARELRATRPLVERLRKGSGAVKPAAAPAGDDVWLRLQASRARLSAAKANAVLGFRAQVDFEEGLRRSAGWFVLRGLLPRQAVEGDVVARAAQ